MPKYLEKKISLGRDDSGALIRKSIYAKTKAELEKKCFAARQDFLAKSSAPPDSSITFMAFARRWLRTEKAQKSPYTQDTYKNIIEKHLAPELEELYFHELALADFQTIINNAWQCPPTCRQIKNTVAQIYSAADDAGLISGKLPNFKKLALPPKIPTERRALTDEEKSALFSADLTEKEQALVALLYYTGIRREECLALVPDCFDFKAKTVSIKKTLTFVTTNQTRVDNYAKNIYSIRTVPLLDPALPYLRDYVRTCPGFLFPEKHNAAEPITLSQFHSLWRRIRLKLDKVCPGARALHPHLFRHNYATMLYYSELSPKMAAKLLGHADTKMINEVYAHLDEAKERAAEKLNAVFAP